MMEDMPCLSERPKWELSPVEQLKVAAYRRDLGNAEMRQGHPEKVLAAPLQLHQPMVSICAEIVGCLGKAVGVCWCKSWEI